MAVKTGDVLEREADLRCLDCGSLMHVEAGKAVPLCVCGNHAFDGHREPPRRLRRV